MGFLSPDGDPAWKRISIIADSDGTRPRLSSNFVTPGRILWLPDAASIPAGVVKPLKGSRELGVDEDGTAVVICSRPAEDVVKVHFHTISSFEGKLLAETYPYSPSALHNRLSYLPIFPSPPHPDRGKRECLLSLELVNGEEFTGNAFVKLQDVYAIDWRYLRPYEFELQLNQRSLSVLLQRSRQLSGYFPGPQIRRPQTLPPAIPKPALSLAYRAPPIAVAQYPRLAEGSHVFVRGKQFKVQTPDRRDSESYDECSGLEKSGRHFARDSATRSNGCASAFGSRCFSMVCCNLPKVAKWREPVCRSNSDYIPRRFSDETRHIDPD